MSERFDSEGARETVLGILSRHRFQGAMETYVLADYIVASMDQYVRGGTP